MNSQEVIDSLGETIYENGKTLASSYFLLWKSITAIPWNLPQTSEEFVGQMNEEPRIGLQSWSDRMVKLKNSFE